MFSMSGFPTGDLHPIYNAPMLGAHKSEESMSVPLRSTPIPRLDVGQEIKRI
jgi:hypothetical protein